MNNRISPERQRLDFGRLYCCGEIAKEAGHSWSLIPLKWFETWSKYTGYDRYKDQGAWSSYFRKYKSFEVFDPKTINEAKEHFAKADYGIDLLADSSGMNSIVSPPGPIDLRGLLVLKPPEQMAAGRPNLRVTSVEVGSRFRRPGCSG
jgi:hypothetical protein